MDPSKNHKTGIALKDTVRSAVFLSLLFLSTGCASVHTRAPVTGFPAIKPGMVRLPIEITFPSGGDVLQHIGNFFKGGMKELVPDLRDIPGFRLRSNLVDLWEKMQKPIFLEKDIWLLIRPETLSVGMMRTDLKRASTIHTVLEMTAKPEIIFGPEPPTTPVKMPALSSFKPGPGTFQAMSDTRMTYKEVNRYFKDPRLKLIGRVLRGTGERRVILDGIRFFGSGGKVMAEVKLRYNPVLVNFEDKPAKMTIYLRGTPRYLPKERVFDLPDMEYDIKSSDLMVQVADFILKDEFKGELRKIARLPIGLKMDLVKEKMNKALNRPMGKFTRLHTQVNSFDVVDGFADDEGIEVRLAVKGTATMEVIWN